MLSQTRIQIPLLITLFLLTIISQVSSILDLSYCTETNRCFKYPKNCQLQIPKSDIISNPNKFCNIISWKPKENSVIFTISSTSKNIDKRSGYAGFALSNVPRMQEGDAYVCQIQEKYNDIPKLTSHYIMGKKPPPETDNLNNKKDRVMSLYTEFQDNSAINNLNVIECSLERTDFLDDIVYEGRLADINFRYSQYNPSINPYYLLTSNGGFEQSPYILNYHGRMTRGMSDSKIDFKNLNLLSNSSEIDAAVRDVILDEAVSNELLMSDGPSPIEGEYTPPMNFFDDYEDESKVQNSTKTGEVITNSVVEITTDEIVDTTEEPQKSLEITTNNSNSTSNNQNSTASNLITEMTSTPLQSEQNEDIQNTDHNNNNNNNNNTTTGISRTTTPSEFTTQNTTNNPITEQNNDQTNLEDFKNSESSERSLASRPEVLSWMILCILYILVL